MHSAPKKLREVYTSRFAFSRDEPLLAQASACTIAVLRFKEGVWGLFHGPFNAKSDMRDYSGYTEKDITENETLEDFLRAWQKQTTISGYLFGAGFVSNPEETLKQRETALRKIEAHTHLSPNRLFVNWNEHYEGETSVIVIPQDLTIKVSMDFWE